MPDYQNFVVEPFTPNIGATLHGLDLSQPLSELAQTELKAALARFEVIFFRDQVLTPVQQVAFTRSFGQVNEVKAFFPRVESQPFAGSPIHWRCGTTARPRTTPWPTFIRSTANFTGLRSRQTQRFECVRLFESVFG